MSAIVTQVLPNGNLVIEGKRLVRVNNEEQVMILSGVIRPRDVAADNSILSTLVADAKIFYSGEGVIADKQRPGWLSRGLDKFSPF
jgi:flagellar L-ring protein precursor FlgH